MPFNWKTPNGYLITRLFECILAYCAALFLTPVLCILLKSFAEDITTDLRLLNVNKTSATSDENGKKMGKIFYNTVKCHFNETQEFIILDFFVYALCSSLFVIHLDFVECSIHV